MVTPDPLFDEDVDAQAAAWLARLQGSGRSDATEAAFKSWVHATPAHEEAFERATEIWAMIPGAMLCAPAAEPASRVVPLPVRRSRVPSMTAFAIAASLALLLSVGGGWWLMTRPTDYATRIGEQKVATLDDGSRIALNTDTEIGVSFARDIRRVTLERGEAMFEVAPNPDRPFVVRAGDKLVKAIGTIFIVRRDDSGVVVTLIQGKVSVTDVTKAAAPAMLAPGERFTVTGTTPPLIDQPPIEAATAWRRGQAMFSDAPLSSAVAELNRYGGPRITVDDPHLASLRVSGVFATNDTVEFANAVAALHGLRVRRTGNELHLQR